MQDHAAIVSKFVVFKTCLLYLEEDEPDYLQLTECEFISVSKAYSLKTSISLF